MKTLTILLLSLFFLSFINISNRKDKISNNEVIPPIEHNTLLEKTNSETTVLICTGKYSKRYHNSMCKGMKACKGDRKKVSLSEAKKMGLTACGYCYK